MIEEVAEQPPFVWPEGLPKTLENLSRLLHPASEITIWNENGEVIFVLNF